MSPSIRNNMDAYHKTRSSGGAKCLPAKFYTCDQIFQWELGQLFKSHWVVVCHTSELREAGSFRQAQVGNDPLVVLRDHAGNLRAFHNVCRHRGTMVVHEKKGKLKGQSMTCPYHAWRYGLDGSLLSAPNMHECQGFDASAYPLKPIDVLERFGFVFVKISGPTQSDDLQALANELKNWNIQNAQHVHSFRYQINSNWKLIFLNYSECYHCPVIHPNLSKLTPFKSAQNVFETGSVLGGPMQLKPGVESLTSSSRFVGDIFPDLTEQQTQQISFFTVFPTMFVSPHPDFVMTHTILPQAVDQTEVVCDFFIPPGQSTDPSQLRSNFSLWDQTNCEDWQVSEWSQRGISSSSYTPGPYSNLESVLATFDQYYLSCLPDHLL